MIQQRSTVHQTYKCRKTREVRVRQVQQFAKRHFDHKALAFRPPAKTQSVWSKISSLFRRAA